MLPAVLPLYTHALHKYAPFLSTFPYESFSNGTEDFVLNNVDE